MFPFIHIYELNIPTYGLFFAISILFSGGIAYFRCKKSCLNGDDFLVIGVCAIGVGLVTAWMLYIVITFSLQEIISLIQENMLGELFQGGMVYYGGAIGGFIGALLGARIVKTHILDYVNPVIPCLPLAHAIGRLGCFSAGCCYGIETDSCLGVTFLNPVGGAPVGVTIFPVQLLEAFLNILIFIALIILTKRSKQKAIALPVYLICYSIVRFITEFFRADTVRGFFLGISTSQWISIVFVIVTGGLLLVHQSYKRRNGIK